MAEVLAEYENDSTIAQAFAQLASENLTSSVAGTSTETASPYTISGLSAGYYLVKDQDGSVTAKGDAYTDIILEVVDDVSVTVKAEYPSVTKTVSAIDASIGDTLTYTLTGTVPDTSAYSSYTYIFHDTLSAGLTLVDSSIAVKNGDTTLVKDTDYTVAVDTTSSSDGSTLITITMANAKNLSNSTIVVTYNATLNSDAVIGQGTGEGENGNPNTVYVEYSNNPNWDGDGDEPKGNTPEDKVVTFTFELDVTKVDNESNKALANAEFVLYRTEGSTTEYVQIGTDGKVSGWTTQESDASTLTSDSTGQFSIIGLDAGTYYLEETAAPDGYNRLSAPVTIVITAEYKDADGDGVKDTIDTLTATADSEDLTTSISEGTVSATVENKSGSTLPSTGGIGTTLFYIIGSVMVLAAAVLLITKRRMRQVK
ncbi:MAG: SpaH/EbpB family LPXTG-anchored major pilin [Lachnospiraceae bacterium]|nr:SpaH/EbpB family LPXTG-anchored major pilin [Lachnospiraceae bacterium]